MRLSVLLWGTLEGMGRSAPCELIAIKSSPSGTSGKILYSHCSVIKAPADLPDGDYLLRFAGQMTLVHRRNQSWLVGQQPTRNIDEESDPACLTA